MKRRGLLEVRVPVILEQVLQGLSGLGTKRAWFWLFGLGGLWVLVAGC